MNLTTRPTLPGDLKECLPLIADRAVYKKEDIPRLLSFWHYLLKKRLTHSVVVEDSEKPAGDRIVFFGLTLFVSDEFIQEAKTSLPPPLPRRLFERWLKGRRVFLNRKEIASHHSGAGLNLFGVYYGFKPLPPSELPLVNAKMMESFYQIHSGYRIKEYTVNVFGAEAVADVLQHDFVVWRDYREGPPGPLPEGPSGPYLMGASRENCREPKSMYSIFRLFHPPAPRFHFSPGEKDVLERALFGETDQEISKSLHLSLWAIKKRWQGAYERIEKGDPKLLGPKKDGPDTFPDSPKAERRRYFLDYLRQHLEEIRPTLGPRRKNAAPVTK
jgi:DNA-binding CsgD family transcriptional regulator